MTPLSRNSLLRSLAYAVLVLLYLPLAAVALFSVNSTRYGMVWKGFTLDWYAKLIENEAILEAAKNTLIVASVSTLVSTVLGTALGLGAARYPWPKAARRGLDFTLYLPVVTPDMIFAAALVIAFGVLRSASSIFNPGLFTMIVAHVTFQIAFVALVVKGRWESVGGGIEEAAHDLYADGWQVFCRVTLPLMLPGIVAGAMLAFTLSLDDFIISFFTAGPDSTTLPIYIYSSVRRGVTPEIHALSILILALNVILVIGLERLTRRNSTSPI